MISINHQIGDHDRSIHNHDHKKWSQSQSWSRPLINCQSLNRMMAYSWPSIGWWLSIIQRLWFTSTREIRSPLALDSHCHSCHLSLLLLPLSPSTFRDQWCCYQPHCHLSLSLSPYPVSLAHKRQGLHPLLSSWIHQLARLLYSQLTSHVETKPSTLPTGRPVNWNKYQTFDHSNLPLTWSISHSQPNNHPDLWVRWPTHLTSHAHASQRLRHQWEKELILNICPQD